MKAAELTVGREIAVTDGTDRFAQSPDRATKAQVVEAPEGGYVRVKLLEDARSMIGRSWMSNQGKHKKGQALRIETRKCWMPWEQVSEVIERERRRIAAADQAAEEREEKLAALQRRLDQQVDSTHPALRFYNSREEDRVVLSTETLEDLLEIGETFDRERGGA